MIKTQADGNNNSINYSVLLIMVFVALFLPMCTGMCDYFRPSPNDREAEVKRNLHDIQLALERYATDHDGLYPVFVSGGDWTDSYVVTGDWLAIQNLTQDQIQNETHRIGWQPAPAGMGDALIIEGYMTEYPSNPFLKAQTYRRKPRTIVHHPHPDYGMPFERLVGGADSDKMSEVFGPVMVQKDQGIAGDYYVHHIYNDPPYNVWGDIYKTPENGWKQPRANEVLSGNFSYYPRTEEGLSWPLLGLAQTEDSPQLMAIGYTLAGYGDLRSPYGAGRDVYNRNGDYYGRYRTEPHEPSTSETPVFPDAIQFLSEGQSPSKDANSGGSDTILDGVIITLDNGDEKKAKRVDVGNIPGI